ncbi:MAG: pentapeptide repeat-containing protein [Chlamydiota bacterium]
MAILNPSGRYQRADRSLRRRELKRLLLLLIPIFFVGCFRSDVKPVKGERRHLRNVNLSGADLSHLDLRNVNLSYSSVKNADLTAVDLEGSILVSANFQAAHLRGANLKGTDCRGADFLNARLEQSDFRGADLTHARFVGTDVKQANFRNTAGLTEDQKGDLKAKGALVDE